MIRNNLSKLLGERRMTQKKLADITGIRPATINELYHELNSSITIENLNKICIALNCDVGDLFEFHLTKFEQNMNK